MQTKVIYWAGDLGFFPHTFLFNIGNAGLSGLKAISVTRFIEFWCQLHCRGRWQVMQRDDTLSVAFDRDLDVVIFQLINEEYSRFAYSNSIIDCPHHVQDP